MPNLIGRRPKIQFFIVGSSRIALLTTFDISGLASFNEYCKYWFARELWIEMQMDLFHPWTSFLMARVTFQINISSCQIY